MEYWICITNEENWQIIKKFNVWGVSKLWKKTLLQVKPGDHLLFYLKQTKTSGIPFNSPKKKHRKNTQKNKITKNKKQISAQKNKKTQRKPFPTKKRVPFSPIL